MGRGISFPSPASVRVPAVTEGAPPPASAPSGTPNPLSAPQSQGSSPARPSPWELVLCQAPGRPCCPARSTTPASASARNAPTRAALPRPAQGPQAGKRLDSRGEGVSVSLGSPEPEPRGGGVHSVRGATTSCLGETSCSEQLPRNSRRTVSCQGLGFHPRNQKRKRGDVTSEVSRSKEHR